VQAQWVFLRVNRGTTVALPVAEVHKVLHRMDRDFPTFAPTARSLAAALGVRPDDDLPGILAVLGEGDCWYAGDSNLQALPPGSAYFSLSPELFGPRKPWCRGVLLSDGRTAFVTDMGLLRAVGT
jgi:hypothetical protein